MIFHMITRRRRSVRLFAAAALAAAVVLLPVVPGQAAPTSVTIPITEGGMGVNGTVLAIPTVGGAQLAGTYDPDTGAFDGHLVIPSFTLAGTTSISDSFVLTFSAVDAAVTGTIPQTGTGTLGPVGWTVGVEIVTPYSITGCTVTIAPLALTTTFDAESGGMSMIATGYEIPGADCTGGLSDESDVNAILGIPTTTTALGLLAVDASALRPPAVPEPSFTG